MVNNRLRVLILSTAVLVILNAGYYSWRYFFKPVNTEGYGRPVLSYDIGHYHAGELFYQTETFASNPFVFADEPLPTPTLSEPKENNDTAPAMPLPASLAPLPPPIIADGITAPPADDNTPTVGLPILKGTAFHDGVHYAFIVLNGENMVVREGGKIGTMEVITIDNHFVIVKKDDGNLSRINAS